MKMWSELRPTCRVTSPRWHARGQAGFALAEILAAVIVFGVGISAVFMTLLAVFTSSDVNRDVVLSGIEATNIVESVQRAAYDDCPNANYDSALPSTPGMTLSVTDVKYLVNNVSETGSFQTACPGSGDKGVQRITVMARPVAHPGRSETLVIFKRNDTCPGAPTTGERC